MEQAQVVGVAKRCTLTCCDFLISDLALNGLDARARSSNYRQRLGLLDEVNRVTSTWI